MSLKIEFRDKILWFILENFIFFVSILIIELIALVVICSKKCREDVGKNISQKYLGGKTKSLPSTIKKNDELPEY